MQHAFIAIYTLAVLPLICPVVISKKGLGPDYWVTKVALPLTNSLGNILSKKKQNSLGIKGKHVKSDIPYQLGSHVMF